jgi:DNA-binding transcriptional regulator GbsR (MarR family)
MPNKPLREAQKQLIEKMGVHLEKEGLSPAAARILGILIVSDEVELTFEDIYQSLGISKSTASSTINMLQTTGRIEYITKPGDRKRYFRSKINNWIDGFEEKFASMEDTKSIFREVLEQRTKETKEFNKSLALLILFLEFIQGEMPELIEKFKKKHIK